jgi:drug/metabolite transporter (DMT)-like permease
MRLEHVAVWAVDIELLRTFYEKYFDARSNRLGALVVTSAAFVANAVTLIVIRARGHEIVSQWEALWLLAIAGVATAGVATAGVDLCTLLAYERGLRLSSSLIVGGTSTALVLVIGFVALQEPVTWARVLALGLIAVGVLLLQTQGG